MSLIRNCTKEYVTAFGDSIPEAQQLVLKPLAHFQRLDPTNVISLAKTLNLWKPSKLNVLLEIVLRLCMTRQRQDLILLHSRSESRPFISILHWGCLPQDALTWCTYARTYRSIHCKEGSLLGQFPGALCILDTIPRIYQLGSPPGTQQQPLPCFSSYEPNAQGHRTAS